MTVGGIESETDLRPAAAPPVRRPSRADSIRPTYGFDDVSLAPGVETVEPSDVDVATDFAGVRLAVPILAAAMDAVVDVRLAA